MPTIDELAKLRRLSTRDKRLMERVAQSPDEREESMRHETSESSLKELGETIKENRPPYARPALLKEQAALQKLQAQRLRSPRGASGTWGRGAEESY